jgi:hypothetical protein
MLRMERGTSTKSRLDRVEEIMNDVIILELNINKNY